MSAPEDPEVTDPELRRTARMLKDLPAEAPPPSLTEAVLTKVRPVASRRRQVLRAVAVAALLAAAAWAVMMLRAVSEGMP